MRAPATRRAGMSALADADPAHKVAAAAPRITGAGPPATDAILERGQGAFDRGDYPEALRRGREAIAAGGALGGHLLAGDAYYRLERFPDALREYQAALALDPGNTSIKRRRDLVEQAGAR
jgi:tetratricopeptide (TPR) repeat protein